MGCATSKAAGESAAGHGGSAGPSRQHGPAPNRRDTPNDSLRSAQQEIEAAVAAEARAAKSDSDAGPRGSSLSSVEAAPVAPRAATSDWGLGGSSPSAPSSEPAAVAGLPLAGPADGPAPPASTAADAGAGALGTPASQPSSGSRSPATLSMDNPRSTESIFISLEDKLGDENAWKAAKKRHSMQVARMGDGEDPAAPSKAAREFHQARRSIEMRRNSMAVEAAGGNPLAPAAAAAAAAPARGSRRSLAVEGSRDPRRRSLAFDDGDGAARRRSVSFEAPPMAPAPGSMPSWQSAGASGKAPSPRPSRLSLSSKDPQPPPPPKAEEAAPQEAAEADEDPQDAEPTNAFAEYRRFVARRPSLPKGSTNFDEPRPEGQTKAAREFHQARKSIEAKRMSLEVPGSIPGDASGSVQDNEAIIAVGKMPWMMQSLESGQEPKVEATEDETFGRMLRERAAELETVRTDLQPILLLLAVLPHDTPVPAQMLQRLWAGHMPAQLSFAEAVETLEGQGYIFTAQPNDSTLWVLVDEGVQQQLQEVAGDLLPQMHAALLHRYISEEGAQAADVPDDGYFMHNVSFHLSEASMTKELRQLLADPFWLEEKLHSYGVASTVVDFRRYLTISDSGADDVVMRLYLQAFQMSVGSCLTHIDACVLPAQMMARLHSLKDRHPELAEWIDQVQDQYSKGKFLGRRTADAMQGKSARRYRYLRSKGSKASGSVGSNVSNTCQQFDVGALPAKAGSIPSRMSADSYGSESGHSLIRCLAPMTPTLEQAGGGARMALRGHSGALTCMELSPDAMDLVTCAADGSTCLWDMEIGDCVLLLEGTSHVSCVGLSLNAGLVLTGTKEGTIHVWDLDGGSCKKTLRPHKSEVTCLKVAPNGSLVVSGSASGSVGVWALASDRIMHHLLGHTSQVLCMDVLFSVAWTEDHCQTLTGSADFTARLWNLRSGKVRSVLEGHTGWVRSACLTPDGEVAVTGSNDCTVRVWDCQSGECFNILAGHGGPVNAIQVHDELIASASDDQTVRIWNLDSGACLLNLNQHSGWLNTVAIKGATCIAAGSDGNVYVWDIGSGSVLAVMKGHSDEVVKCDISPDEKTAVTISVDNSARIWDIEAACHEYKVRDAAIPRHAGSAEKLTVCRGGAIVSAGHDGRAFAWNVADGGCESVLDEHSAAIKWLSSIGDGSQVITASGDRHICTWNVNLASGGQGELVRSLPIERGSRVKSFSCSADGAVGAIVLFDSSLGIWDLVTGELITMLQRRGDRDQEFVHSGGINGVVLSQDGSIAVTYSKDCTARVWDVSEGCSKFVLSGHTEDVVAAALSTEQSAVVTASYDGTARVWDLMSGECTALLTGHGRDVHGVEMSPDGGIVATLAGHITRVWETESGSLLHTLDAGAAIENEESSTSPIAAFDSVGVFMLTAVEERVNIWELKTGLLVYVFVADCSITSAAFAGTTLAGDTIVVGDVNGNVHFVNIPPLPRSKNARLSYT